MPRESDQYIRVKLKCQSCFTPVHCRVLARRESAMLVIPCPQCHQDVAACIIPDEKFDNQKNEKGLWVLPVSDLVCMQTCLTEHEGDRLLWGLGEVLESRITALRERESK